MAGLRHDNIRQVFSDGEIFPAAAYYWNRECLIEGCNGNYWSRSLRTDYPVGVWSLFLDSDDCGMSYYNRELGFSVRPVRENSK